MLQVNVASALVLLLAIGPAAFGDPAAAQAPPVSPRPQPPRDLLNRRPPPPPTAPEPVEKLGPNLFRVGTLRVDTQRKEVTADGAITGAVVLEFIANTKGGLKAYESAIELDTNALNFNVALLLIGMDKANSVPPTRHLDPASPKGDPLEIWVEWTDAGRKQRVRAEELVFNEVTKRTLPEGPWVYTGSSFSDRAKALLADLDGALIGFAHTPSPLIDNPAALVGPYGANRLNPAFNLKAGDAVVVTVRALPKAN